MYTIEVESQDFHKVTEQIVHEAAKADAKKIYCNKKLHDLIKTTSDFVVANDSMKKENNAFATVAGITLYLDENMKNETSMFKIANAFKL